MEPRLDDMTALVALCLLHQRAQEQGQGVVEARGKAMGVVLEEMPETEAKGMEMGSRGQSIAKQVLHPARAGRGCRALWWPGIARPVHEGSGAQTFEEPARLFWGEEGRGLGQAQAEDAAPQARRWVAVVDGNNVGGAAPRHQRVIAQHAGRASWVRRRA